MTGESLKIKCMVAFPQKNEQHSISLFHSYLHNSIAPHWLSGQVDNHKMIEKHIGKRCHGGCARDIDLLLISMVTNFSCFHLQNWYNKVDKFGPTKGAFCNWGLWHLGAVFPQAVGRKSEMVAHTILHIVLFQPAKLISLLNIFIPCLLREKCSIKMSCKITFTF